MRSHALLITIVLATSCGKNTEPPPPTSGVPNAPTESGPSRPPAAPPAAAMSGSAQARAQAQQMFATVCAMCHGMDGSGNGPAAATLNPKPRNYTDPAWQASVTDDLIKETILKGGQAMNKSPMMPGNPQLADHPEVLDDLVQMIRQFGKHP